MRVEESVSVFNGIRVSAILLPKMVVMLLKTAGLLCVEMTVLLPALPACTMSPVRALQELAARWPQAVAMHIRLSTDHLIGTHESDPGGDHCIGLKHADQLGIFSLQAPFEFLSVTG